MVAMVKILLLLVTCVVDSMFIAGPELLGLTNNGENN